MWRELVILLVAERQVAGVPMEKRDKPHAAEHVDEQVAERDSEDALKQQSPAGDEPLESRVVVLVLFPA